MLTVTCIEAVKCILPLLFKSPSYIAEALTEGFDGYCVTSIVNTSEEDDTIELPFVALEEVKNDCDNSVLIFFALANENGNRLSKLRNELRIEHLNSERECHLLRFARNITNCFIFRKIS